MLKNRLTSYLLLLTFLLFPHQIYADSNDLTVYTYRDNYIPAKYEPNEGIYLGAYILQDTLIKQSMNIFNDITRKKHASYFIYVGYGQPFPTKWVEEVKSVNAVPHIALEPNDGLDKVKDDDYLRNFAKEAKKADVPIFLRYASEMNGSWSNYSGNPTLFKEKWKLVHRIMKEEAPNVIMVWTVFTFPEKTITEYYPGDEFVDWVGVNIYNVMYHNNNIKVKADHEDPLNLLDFVYHQYSYKKPIQISEYGVTHYSVTDHKYYIDFAKSKLKRLYENLPDKYPRVKSIYYFDTDNITNGSEGREINDYSITNNEEILNVYQRLIADDQYLSTVVQEKNAHRELLSYRGKIFYKNGKTYIDADFYRHYLNMDVKINKNDAMIDGKKFPVVYKTVNRGIYNQKWRIIGIPIRNVAEAFDYHLSYDEESKSIYIYK